MTAYRLSRKADDDLQGIFRYTRQQHGIARAAAYLTQLEECFLQLADNPGLAQSVEFIRSGYFRYLHQKHAIYFVRRADHIFIARVLHQRMKASVHIE